MLKYYSNEGPERCGFILKTGKVIEVDNVSENKNNSFAVLADDIFLIEDSIAASWHTHPGSSSNLSGEDLVAFQNYPDWKHLIVGLDGISCYSVTEAGSVVRDAEENYPTWAVE